MKTREMDIAGLDRYAAQIADQSAGRVRRFTARHDDPTGLVLIEVWRDSSPRAVAPCCYRCVCWTFDLTREDVDAHKILAWANDAARFLNQRHVAPEVTR